VTNYSSSPPFRLAISSKITVISSSIFWISSADSGRPRLVQGGAGGVASFAVQLAVHVSSRPRV
jgi:NADPH:quinone reductase-like Zn-dependent oxidoreductase